MALLLLKVRLYLRDHLDHLGLLAHLVPLLLTDLRHLKVRRLHLVRQSLEDHLDRWDLLAHLVPLSLKDQHFRWLRGRRLVPGHLMALLFLVGLKFHSAPLGQ